MSTDVPASPTLAGYVEALVAALREADPAAEARLRRVVAGRRARIELDGEAVVVSIVDGDLAVGAATGDEAVDGAGATDRATVRDLLHGRIGVHEAILADRLHVTGAEQDVDRMFLAIEILLDGSARAPGLTRLADELLGAMAPGPGTPVAADPLPERDELALLNRLDLLPSP